MTISGYIEDGRVVTTTRVDLPDGTPVEVSVVKTESTPSPSRKIPSLAELAGTIPNSIDPNEYHESRIEERS